MIIENADGLEFLSTLANDSVDLVLTDPPYITSRETGMDKWKDHVELLDSSNKNAKSEKQWEEYSKKLKFGELFPATKDIQKEISKAKGNFIKYGSIYGKKYAVRTDYGKWDSEFRMEDLELFINHFYRVLKPGGTCIIFFDIWKITPLKASLESNPTQKSLPLFEELIKKHSKPKDLVLDCFLGSGTTAIAAHNTDRKFIGCEKSEEYYHKMNNILKKEKII